MSVVRKYVPCGGQGREPDRLEALRESSVPLVSEDTSAIADEERIRQGEGPLHGDVREVGGGRR